MIEEAIRKFAEDHFWPRHFPVFHGETDKILPLALAVKQHRPLWRRPFGKSELVVLDKFETYVKHGAQKTVCESIATSIKDEELCMKQMDRRQQLFSRTKSDESDANAAGLVGVTVRLSDNQGVLTLGNLSQKYIDDPDLRGILANAELDANKMKAFAECDELFLITSVIHSEKFELNGERMHQTEVAAEVKNLPPQLQFLNLNRNSPLKIHVRDTYFPPYAAASNSQAPFLIRFCHVDYDKKTNRLEIRKREYERNVLMHKCGPWDDDEDGGYYDNIVKTTDQTDQLDCLTDRDIERMENIYEVVLLSEKTTAQRKARVSKYRHWFEEALMADQKHHDPIPITGMTLEDCDFLESVYLPCELNMDSLDLDSLSPEEIQDFFIAFKVLDDLSDEQWKGLELSLAADPEH